MRPSASCELYVDGVRVPDRDDSLIAGQVTALDGLSINWGRDGQNEQPTGLVLAADQTTYDNGSFNGRTGAVKIAEATMINGATGSYVREALQVTPPKIVTAPNWPGVIVPPRPFQGAQQLPTVWDTITKASAGETWELHVNVLAAVGTPYQIGLVAFSGPTAAALVSGFTYTLPNAAGVGTGVWQSYDLTAQITALPAPAWLALRVDHTDDPWARGRWQDQVTAWDAASGAWNDASRMAGLSIDDLALYPPADTLRRVLVFSGNVSDLKVTPESISQINVAVTAADIGSELGNRVIGDNPWAAQTAGVRANRILDLAGIERSKLSFDPSLAALNLTYRDVDAQPAYPLLQDLAQSVGGTLWTAAHITSGSYLLIENPQARSSVKEFTWGGTASVLDATNLSPNPSLEGGLISGWASNNPTSYPLTIDSTAPIAGTYSAVSTRQSANLATTVASIYTTAVPCAAGIPMIMSVDFRAELAARRAAAYCQWLDGAGAVITSDPVVMTVTDTVAGQVYRLTHTGSPPAGAVTCRPLFTVYTMSGNAIVGERVWFDRLRVSADVYRTPDAELTTYFDGDTLDVEPFDYLWTGPALASTSERWVASGSITIEGGGAGTQPLSACDVLMEPVSWEQDTADVITVVAVTWQEQTLDDDGLPAPTERTVIVQDDAAISTYGTRRLSYATELIKIDDASSLASRLLNQARAVGWRMDGVTIDSLTVPDEIDSVDDRTRAVVFLDLLDATIRMGYGLVLIDLPPYAPRGTETGLYVEGGRYRFESGAWSLSLTLTPSGGQGKSARWADVAANQPGWRWKDFDQSVRWLDCYGTTVPA